MMDYSLLKSINFKSEINYDLKKKDIQNVISLDMRTDGRNLSYWTAWIESGKDFIPFHGKSYEDLSNFFDELCDCSRVEEMEEPMRSFLLSQKDKFGVEIHIYDHRLSHDFQLLRNIYGKEFAKLGKNVFARTERRPYRAKARNRKVNMYFHETSILASMPIDDWAHTIGIDFSKIENDKLDQLSFGSSLITAKGMVKYREKYGTLSNIPMTQSGCVRKNLKEKLLKNNDWTKTCGEALKSYDFKTYSKLCRAFIGGSCGFNNNYLNILLENVESYDISSAYPFVLASKKFPVGPWEKTDKNDDENYFYLYEVEITNICSKYQNLFFPSEKIENEKNSISFNDKLYSADMIKITVTDIDLDTIKKMYDYDDITYISIYRSKAEYLPNEISYFILKIYIQKTQLKGIDEVKYNEIKRYINCIYGVFVTRDITDDVYFIHKDVGDEYGWDTVDLTKELFDKKLEEMKQKPQWKTYQIGVWVTAYVRSILFDMIAKFDNRIVYFDTDCIKGFFTEEDKAYIKQYNESTESTEKYPIGQFLKEDAAEEFKVIGTKTYASKVKGKIKTTIAGLPKEAGPRMIKNVDDLEIGIKWSKELSGRTTTTYYDKKGNYGVSIEGAEFEITEKDLVLDLMNGLSNSYLNKTKIFRDM